MIVEPSWWQYAIFDDNGLCGISDEAPKTEKEKYAEYLKKQKETKEKGIKM